MKIVIEGLNEQERDIAKQLLVDALREFMTAREGNYVERRYASHDADFKAWKAASVEARQELAAKFVQAMFDNLDLVPEKPAHDSVYVVIPGAAFGGRIGIVKYNEPGYYQTDFDNAPVALEAVDAAVWSMNNRLGIPEEVVEAMHVGSMFGWDVPGAKAAHNYFSPKLDLISTAHIFSNRVRIPHAPLTITEV